MNGAAHALLGAVGGRTVGDVLGESWRARQAEALAGASHSRPLELAGDGARRAWCLRLDPIAAPGGGDRVERREHRALGAEPARRRDPLDADARADDALP
ncbi:MAG: hypothetical protein KIT31_32450 [Deltaproteobacteria bacterium]|nr:hypothetical protein [Deltaproteobacteria bacterium]